GNIAQVVRVDIGRLLVILDRDGLGAGGGVVACVAGGPPGATVVPYTTLFRSLAVVAGGADAGHRAVVGGGGRAQGHRGGRTFIGDRKSTRLDCRHVDSPHVVILVRKGMGAGGGVGAGVADGPGDERVANRIEV